MMTEDVVRHKFITVGGPTAGEVGWCHPESVVASYTRFDYAFGGD